MVSNDLDPTTPPPIAFAHAAFGSLSGGSSHLRSLAWASPEELGIDLADPKHRQFGDYELIELLGRGGMGAVYRARQLDLERDVAIKFLAAGPWASDEFIARFRREARAAARMQHPNIVEVYETGERDGLYFFSMRLVNGPTLGDVLQREGPMPALRAARLLRTTALAIDYAHRLGVLHLDLKPGNVLLSDGEPLVADFGLARRIDDGPRGDQEDITGTPSYMSPEQAQARTTIGPAADIYGLGAILYELLVGEPPFRGSSPQETLHQVVRDVPVAPRQRLASIPKDIEAICIKCLDKDPSRRYETAGALADDLRRFVDGEAVAARVPGIVERGGRWVARNRAAAIAGLLLVAGVVGTTHQMLRADEARREAETHRARSVQRLDLIAHSFPVPRDTASNEAIELSAERIVARLRSDLAGREDEQQRVLIDLFDAFDRADNPSAAGSLLRSIVVTLGGDYRRHAAEAQFAKGTARGKILGAILLHPLTSETEADAGIIAREQALIAEAIDLAPDDLDVLAVGVYYCRRADSPCAERKPWQRLVERDPDNAAHWAFAMEADEPEAVRLGKLERMVEAPKFDDHLDRLLGLHREAVETSGVPVPALMRAASERLNGTGVTVEETMSYFYIAYMPVPSINTLALTCRPDHAAMKRPEVRALCLEAGKRAAYESRALIGSLVGATIIRHAAPGTEDALRAREIRRGYIYAGDALRKRTPAQVRRSQEWLIAREGPIHGELEAWKRALDRAGIPRDPPEGWMPDEPEQLMTGYERELYRAKRAALAATPMLPALEQPAVEPR